MDYVQAKSKEEVLEWMESIPKTDTKSISFMKTSISLQDMYYKWVDEKRPWFLIDKGEKVTIISVNHTKDKYFSVRRVLTPKHLRRNGYAKEVMSRAWDYAYNVIGCDRLRINCGYDAVPFYNSLGFLYWGLTRDQAMYGDFPMVPKMDDFPKISSYEVSRLVGRGEKGILRKLNIELNQNPDKKGKQIIDLAGDRYIFQRLSDYYSLDKKPTLLEIL